MPDDLSILTTLEEPRRQEKQSQLSHLSLHLRIASVCPLLMHNARLADPSYSFSQAIKSISGKRNKTEADFAEMSRLEFLGGLYLFNGEPCIPGEVLEATLINAAKKKRLGQQALMGVMCDEMYPLQYEGPRDPLKLWEDPSFRLVTSVRVQRARVMRTRPRFSQWTADIEVKYMPSHIDEKRVREIVEIAGRDIGLCDWRPKFGRFEVL